MTDYLVKEEDRLKLAAFIRKTRESKGISMTKLAKILNVHNSWLHKLETGDTQKVNPYLLKEISVHLDLDYKFLYHMIGYLDEYRPDQATSLPKFKVRNPDGLVTGEFDLVRSVSEGVAFFNIDDDAMYPAVPEGSIIGVDGAIEEVVDGKIYLFRYRNRFLLRIYKEYGDETVLQPLNNAYPPISIRKGEPFFTIGKMTLHYKR